MTAATMEPWKHSMKTTQAYTQLCFSVGDFSYFDGRVALQEKAPLAYRNQFRAIVENGGKAPSQYLIQGDASFKVGAFSSDNSSDLEGIAKKSGDDVDTKLQRFSDELQGQMKEKPSDPSELPNWRERLAKKNEERKAEINQMMDDSMNKAMAKIEELPKDQQDKAADAYTSAWDYIMVAVKKVMEFLDLAWSAIVNVWNSVVHGIQVFMEGAVNTVKEWAGDAGRAVSGAISKIGDVFRGIFG